MNLIARRRVTLVCGSSGTGKTEFAERYLRARLPKLRAAFLFDPDGEWSHRLGVAPCRSPWDITKSLAAPRAVICFDPLAFGDNAAAFQTFCIVLFGASEKLRGEKLVIVDEVQSYTRATSIPEVLRTIVQQGRRRGLESVFITNEVNQTPGAIASQVTELVALQQSSKPALDFVEARGFDRAAVAALPPLHWLSKSLVDAGQSRGTLRFTP